MMPTPEEHEAFVWMQGRMVALLLRHDAPRFGTTFGQQQAARLPLDALRRERELAVLFFLRDELFDSILPRIKRRLSFAAPRELAEEQLPPRGRIDWPRTAAAALRERPGEPPLEVWTRQRRRHFATPENLLTVATLLEYRDAAQRRLDDEAARDGAWALRHPLHAIVEGCTRELAFLQFAGLAREAAAILEGSGPTTVETLEESVADKLLPGRNSAYDDLLAWRRRLRELDLLDRSRDDQALPMLGSDPARDNYLYQLWLFYELGDLLGERGALRSWDQERMALEFVWGTGETVQQYRLQHDQKIDDENSLIWDGEPPGVRPDLYIERVGRHKVRDGSALVWREPGYLLDAKYYRPQAAGSEKKPAEPVKRMLADLLLTDERYGALLFAFHGHSPAAVGLTIRPRPQRAQLAAPDVRVDQWQIRPEATGEIRALLVAVLDRVHTALGRPVAPQCRGVFLDALGVDAQGRLASAAGLVGRDGAPLPDDPADLLACPKPHIGSGRVDLVSLSRDCCRNAAVCHIKSQPGAQPPRRLERLADLRPAIRPASDEDADAALAAAAERQAALALRRYVLLLRPDLHPQREALRALLGPGDLFDTATLLSAPQRETLALARLLWEQIEQSGGDSYAGPALLLTGVLDELARRTVGLLLSMPYGGLTALGNPEGRAALQAAVEHSHWRIPSEPRRAPGFSEWIDLLPPISRLRRDAARAERLGAAEFQRLCGLLFGDATSHGALGGLLLAWRP